MRKKRFDLVLFDGDGTLTDTIMSIAISANATLEDYNKAPMAVDEFPAIIGNGAARLVKDFMTLAFEEPPSAELFAEAFARYRDHFEKYCTEGVRAFPGIVSLLTDMRSAGTTIGILSNKPHPETVKVAEEIFPGMFHVVRGQIDDGPRKPDPELIYEQLEAYGVPKERACMVGDGDTDVLVGQRAGVTTIAVGWGYRHPDVLKELSPDFYAGDVPTLRRLLLEESP